MIQYLPYSISITLGSWLIGMVLNEIIKKKPYYTNVSNLNFIKSDRLNNFVGIGLLKWVVKNTFFKYLNEKLTLKNSINIAQLREIRIEMTHSEISHLLAFGAVTIMAIYESISSNYLFGLTIMSMNVLLNLYPSLLQQQNKRRIDTLIQKYAFR